MATLDERVGKLETRVGTLETWSGPGQIEALLEGQRELRREVGDLGRRLGGVERVQQQHTRMLAGLRADVGGLQSDVATLKTDVATLKTDVATLKTDVATLKTDVAELKDGMRELLRRLPPPPAAS